MVNKLFINALKDSNMQKKSKPAMTGQTNMGI